jgi:hypothetical protein
MSNLLWTKILCFNILVKWKMCFMMVVVLNSRSFKMLNMQIILKGSVFIATVLVKVKYVKPQGSFFLTSAWVWMHSRGVPIATEVQNKQSSLMSKNRGRTSGSLLGPDCNTFRAYCVVEHNPKLQNIANCSWYLLCLLKPYFVQYPRVCFLIKRMKVSFGLQLWNFMLHWVTGPAFV